MEMYYTKREYNQMKHALTSENKRLKKQIEKLQKKVKELEYTKEVVFEPDFEMDPVAEETTPTLTCACATKASPSRRPGNAAQRKPFFSFMMSPLWLVRTKNNR